eukprot:7113753-Prymnesium_polylepis.1
MLWPQPATVDDNNHVSLRHVDLQASATSISMRLTAADVCYNISVFRHANSSFLARTGSVIVTHFVAPTAPTVRARPIHATS